MKQFIFCLFFLAGLMPLSPSILAQPKSTSASTLQQSMEKQKALEQTSRFQALKFKNIGPAVMSGRVTALAVNDAKPSEFLVAYASGGLWHTQNNGTTFQPLMDQTHTQNIGALAVDWKNRTIWVGTGENNSSRSSYAGIGLIKSKDFGQSWEPIGLYDSHHIGAIRLNPNNPNEAVVAVIGHLYSPNEERGIFKTTDGGKTWRKTLYINDETGIIDLASAPEDFNVQYAAAWQRDRKAWNFVGNGPHSGIYKSTDAGDTWTLLTTPDSGLPNGEGVGRMGLAVVNASEVYVIHDSQFRRPKENGADVKKEGLQKDDFKTMSVSEFQKLDNKALNAFLKNNRFPQKHSATSVKKAIKNGSLQPYDLARYLEDENSLLFDTEVVGAEIFKTLNGGQKWEKTHQGYLDGLYYSYGYYFGKIHVSPANAQHIYVYGVPVIKSKDGGQTFESMNAANVHADHHDLWINPNDPHHLILGNDGGVNISYDDGQNWIKNNQPSVGQFYAINVDNAKPYNVYGGLQDNGVWVAPHTSAEGVSWHQSGHNPWTSIMGGDGMQIQIDSRDPNLVYTGYQFGNYFRINRKKGENTRITPKHDLGSAPLRFNWQTPILLSAHNPDILYLGSNKLHRSLNQGDDWSTISPDLSHGGKKGNVSYGTLTTIDESVFGFGKLVVGTDDGRIQISENSGSSWTDISQSLPKDLWVSRVQFSKHQENRLYATLNGYRWDDFSPYVYVSEDNGQSWKSIINNLPHASVNVIKEDLENENLLFLGTDNGLFVSLDRGLNWEAMATDLPKVAVHDLVIQAEEKHLLVGTHGRSIYLRDIATLQSLNESVLSKPLHVFEPKPFKHSAYWGTKRQLWSESYAPKFEVMAFVKGAGTATLEIFSDSGELLFHGQQILREGLQSFSFEPIVNQKLSKRSKLKLETAENGKCYLSKGIYQLKLTKAGEAQVQLKIE